MDQGMDQYGKCFVSRLLSTVKMLERHIENAGDVAARYTPILDKIKNAIRTSCQKAPARDDCSDDCPYNTTCFLESIRHAIMDQVNAETTETEDADVRILNAYFGPDSIYGTLLSDVYEILRPYSTSSHKKYDSAFEIMSWFYPTDDQDQHALTNDQCQWLPELSWLTTRTVSANQSRVNILHPLWIEALSHFVNYKFNKSAKELARMKRSGMAFRHANELQTELVYKGEVFAFWDHREADVFRGWVKTVATAAPGAVGQIYDSKESVNHHSLPDLLKYMAKFSRELSATVNPETGELEIQKFNLPLFSQKAFPTLDTLLVQNLPTLRRNINENPSFLTLSKFLVPGYEGGVPKLSTPILAIDALKLATQFDRRYNTIAAKEIRKLPLTSPTVQKLYNKAKLRDSGIH